MKIFRFALSAIILVVLIGCTKDPSEQPNPTKPSDDKISEWLVTLPGVHSIQELASEDYKKHYLIQFKQLLDPKNPAAGTFLQRVFLSHQDFNSPVIFETEGYNAQSEMTDTKQTELTNRYHANRVVVEHRYSGLSLPSSFDWKHLTSENAAADLHAVRVSLGTGYTGSWIATGVSKSGTNAMSYIMYYPTDMTAAVAYVGPICNSRQDRRFVTHMQTVATPEMRKRIVDFQRELLLRRDRIQPIFYITQARSTQAKEYMSADQLYESTVVDFQQSVWQYGLPTEKIPEADATDQQILDYLYENAIFGPNPSPMPREMDRSRTNIGDYIRTLNVRLTRTDGEPDLSHTHYYVQAIIELGGYAYYIEPLEDLIPDHELWSINTMVRFVVPADAADIPFSNKLHLEMNQWLQSQDPRLICVYGEYDPWTAAAPDRSYFAGKANMAIFIQEKGSHSAEIESLALADKQQAWTKLDSWIKQ